MGRSFFRPAASNTIESYDAARLFTTRLSDTHFSMMRRDGEYFQRRWQTRLRRQRDQCRGVEDRLCDGLGQPRAVVPASHRTRDADRTAARLVSPKAKPRVLGHVARAPIPTIRAPAASSRTSACSATTPMPKIPAGQRSSGQRSRYSRAISRKASIASAVTVPAAITFAPSRPRRHSRRMSARAS